MRSLIFKTIVGSLITLGVFVAAIFIFGESEPLTIDGAKRTAIPRFESVSTLTTQKRIVSTNATKELAEELAAEIIAQNPDGPETTETGRHIASINPEVLAQKVIEQTFSDITVEDLRPNISEESLHIIKSASKETLTAYFNNVQSIFARNFPPRPAFNWSNPSQVDFAGLLTSFQGASAELMKLAVPQPLAQLHRELITVLGAQANALMILKNYEADPAQAAIAIEAGQRFTEELQLVSLAMDAYIAEHQITLTAN